MIEDMSDGGLSAVLCYPVDDPYGAERSAATLSNHFGCRILPERITFGAGVTALLRHLSDLADGGTVLVGRVCHMDVPVWAMQRGSRIEVVDRELGPAAVVQAITRTLPALVHLDRPTFEGSVDGHDALLAIGRAAARWARW